jgi:hypothetical protein
MPLAYLGVMAVGVFRIGADWSLIWSISSSRLGGKVGSPAKCVFGSGRRGPAVRIGCPFRRRAKMLARALCIHYYHVNRLDLVDAEAESS